jgi:hypothetical protein
MSMKKILMAAVAVSALSAGAANAALSLDTSGTGSTVGSVYLNPTTGTTVESYTIANELNLTSTTSVATVLALKPTTATSIGIGNYLVTYNISGGTFDTSGIAPSSLALTGGTGTVTSTSTVSATSISFIVNQTAGNITGLALTVPVLTGTSRTPVVISGGVQTTGSLLPVDGGAITPVTIIDYRNGLNFTATKNDLVLTLASGFKKFVVGTDAVQQNIASAVGFTANTGLLASDVVYKSTGASALAAADVVSAVLTIGGDLSAFNVKLGATTNVGTLGADVSTVPGVITADSTNLAALKTAADYIVLAQKSTPVAGTESAYTVTPVITLPAGLTPLTYTAKAIGSTSFEGKTVYAPWVGDGVNGVLYTIRLANRTNTPIGSVKVSLMNPETTGTSGTVVSSAACEVGPIPASKELLITETTLKTCFGTFKRSDIKVLFQGAYTDITAKLRTVAGGVTTYIPMGNGTDFAKAD